MTNRRCLFQETISLILILLFVSTYAHAHSAEYIQLNLPRVYSGIFQWSDGKGLQSITIEIDSLEIQEGGDLVAKGKGIYQVPGHKTNIDIHIQIDPASLAFEMWETNPDTDYFATEGSHKGFVSEDFKTINAKWISEDTGKEGKLELFAKE